MMKHLAAYFRLTVLYGVIMVALYPLSVNAYLTGEGTITLKDSTVYDDITYEVNRYHKTIEFEVNGEKRAVSFTDIAEITDIN